MNIDISQNIAMARALETHRSLRESKIVSKINLLSNNIQLTIAVQTNRNEISCVADRIRALIEPKFLDKSASLVYSSFITFSDELYELIANSYSSRDVTIILVNENGEALEVTYNTQTLAI